MNTKCNTLALTYLEKYFASDFEGLAKLFVEDLIFNGPFVNTTSAHEYINSLQTSSLEEMTYKIIKQYEDQDSVCIVYEMVKNNIHFPVVQVFEFKDSKIAKITTVFDGLNSPGDPS